MHSLQLSNQLAGQLKQSNIKVVAEVRLQANDPTRAIRTMKVRIKFAVCTMTNPRRNVIEKFS